MPTRRTTLAMIAALALGAVLAVVGLPRVRAWLATDDARWAAATRGLRGSGRDDRLAASRTLARLAFEQEFGGEIRTAAQVRELEADLGAIAREASLRSEDLEVRSALVKVLGAPRLRDHASEAVRPLADVIRDESDDPELRAEILASLAPIGPRPLFQGAVVAATASPEARVRAAAFIALDPMELNPAVLLPILDRALDDPEDTVRLSAVELAGDLADKDVPGALELLARAFRSSVPTVRKLALVRLKTFGPEGKQVVPDLLRELKTTADPAFRLDLASALAGLTGDSRRYLPYLIEGLRSNDARVWQHAASSLMYAWRRGVESDERVPALQALLDDAGAGPDVQARAAVALAVITGQPERYKRWIVRGLVSHDPMTRSWVNIWGGTALRGPFQAYQSSRRWQVRGVTFLGIFAAVLAVGLFVRWDIKQFLRRAEEKRKSALVFINRRPRRIRVEPREPLPWARPEAVAERVADWWALGFEDFGSFAIVEVPASRLRALAKPDEGLLAMVGEHDQYGLFHSLTVEFQDGSGLTLSTLNRPCHPESRPGRETIHLADTDAPSLLARLRADRPDGPVRPIARDEFPAFYERVHADNVDWWNSRGGATDEDLLALNRARGIDLSEARLAGLRAKVRSQAMRELETSLRERYLDGLGLSAEDRARIEPRLTVVHDSLSPIWLGETFLPLLDDEAALAERLGEPGQGLRDDWIDVEPGGKQKALPWEELPPRLAFAALNARVTEPARYLKVGVLTWPLDTDLYLAPEPDAGAV